MNIKAVAAGEAKKGGQEGDGAAAGAIALNGARASLRRSAPKRSRCHLSNAPSSRLCGPRAPRLLRNYLRPRRAAVPAPQWRGWAVRAAIAGGGGAGGPGLALTTAVGEKTANSGKTATVVPQSRGRGVVSASLAGRFASLDAARGALVSRERP